MLGDENHGLVLWSMPPLVAWGGGGCVGHVMYCVVCEGGGICVL